MAGANNVQFKKNYKSSDVDRARAEYGTVSHAVMAKMGFRPKAGSSFAKAASAKSKPRANSFAKFARNLGVPTAAKRPTTLATRVESPSGKLKLTPGNYTWKKGADGGYSASDGRARLEKKGNTWSVVMRDGSRHPLGKKASFDKAEQAMARHGAK